jgi:hypothetical protein
MKSTEFGDALRKAADVMTSNDAVQLRALAELFASSPLPTVAATVSRLSKAELSPMPDEATVGEAMKALEPLREFIRLYGKPSLASDIDVLIDFLRRFPAAGVRSLVTESVAALGRPARKPKAAMKEDVVLRHLGRLEQTLGNDLTFTGAYNELENDAEVGKLEIAELAKRFTEAAAKSRAAALKKIWARHHTLMSFRAKSESRDGRSAA